MIPGVKKSGSTTLYRWLGAHPSVFLPKIKEPRFFCNDRVYQRGIDWYAGLFAAAGADQIAGEASVGYLHPRLAATAAERIAEVLPAMRFVVVVRDPVERIRSEHRHQVQKGRESRSLLDALADPRNLYVAQSCYFRCLEPYLERFGRDQIVVVRLEDLNRPDSGAWWRVLDHLGTTRIPAPLTVHNVTAEKAPFSPWLRRMWDRGLGPAAKRMPAPIRHRARRFVLRDPSSYEQLLATSEADIPAALLEPVRRDAERLHTELGVGWDG